MHEDFALHDHKDCADRHQIGCTMFNCFFSNVLLGVIEVASFDIL